MRVNCEAPGNFTAYHIKPEVCYCLEVVVAYTASIVVYFLSGKGDLRFYSFRARIISMDELGMVRSSLVANIYSSVTIDNYKRVQSSLARKSVLIRKIRPLWVQLRRTLLVFAVPKCRLDLRWVGAERGGCNRGGAMICQGQGTGIAPSDG